MKSTMQWIVKSSLALGLVFGMSLSTIPAQADSQYMANVMGSLTWDATDGIMFGGFAQPAAFNFSQDDGMGAFTAFANDDTGSGQGFLTVTATASGAAFAPMGWANSAAQATNLVRVENTQTAGTINVDFNAAAIWSVLGEVQDPLTETAVASISLFALEASDPNGPFDNNDVLQFFGSAPPNFNTGSQMNSENFSIPVASGQVVWVGLQATARGEAHSDESNPIPEPTSILLLGSGMVGLGLWQWRRNKRNQNAA